MTQTYAVPRYLTGQQLKNPLIRSALDRISRIVELRGQYLRRIDTVHGDRRTRLEKWVALSQVGEQLLVRLDLAEGVLGYLDVEQGRYVLNTQCKIAHDAGLSAPVLNRLMATLDDAGYVYRRIERVRLDETDANGLHLVRTRVLIRFTTQFWADLGLRYVWERCKKAAIKKRQAALRQIAQQRSSKIEQRSLASVRSERSRANWQRSEQRRQEPPSATALQDAALQQQRTQLIVALAQERNISVREASTKVDEMLQAAIVARQRA
jgi:hypothetical protein